MLANSQFLAVDQRPKKATVSTILLMHAVGVSVDQRHLFEARNISLRDDLLATSLRDVLLA